MIDHHESGKKSFLADLTSFRCSASRSAPLYSSTLPLSSSALHYSAAVVTPTSGEGAVSARMLGSRDIAIGLLLRDVSSAVVARALQVSVLTDVLDLAAAAWGYFEGSLTQEVALSVAGVASATGAFSLYILNA